MKSRHVLVCLTVFGAVLLLCGVLDLLIFSYLFRKDVSKEMTLINGTVSFGEWRDEHDVSTLFNVYVFNVTNPTQILSGQEKPNLQQLGPYKYRLRSIKDNILCSSSKQEVNFSLVNTFHAINETALSAKEALVTTINMPAWTAADAVRHEPFLERAALAGLLRFENVKLFKQLTVHQMLWGYKDSLISALHALSPKSAPDKFGYFYQQNGTIQGNFTVFTGVDDIARVNEIISYNGMKSLPFWSSNTSNSLEGSHLPGIYQPFLHKDDEITTYTIDLCRSVKSHVDSQVKYEKLSLSRYVMDADTLSYEAGQDYCTSTGQCPPNGILNVTTCRSGAPVYMSWPHYYLGTPALRQNVSGLRPHGAAHSSYVDVAPALGVVPRSVRRLQVNARVEPVRTLRRLTGAMSSAPLYLPVLWYEVVSELSRARAHYLHSHFQRVEAVAQELGYLMIACGLLTLLACALHYTYTWCRSARSPRKPGAARLEVARRDSETTPLLSDASRNTADNTTGLNKSI